MQLKAISSFTVLLILGLTHVSTVSTQSSISTLTIRLDSFERNDCSDALMESRSILEAWIPNMSDLDCVRLCAANTECGLALHQRSANGSRSCGLLSHVSVRASGQASTPPLPVTGKCSAYIINPCQNGEMYSAGVCKCPPDYTGTYCQESHPHFCNPSWTIVSKGHSVYLNTTIYEPLIREQTLYHRTKVRFRNDTLGLEVVMRKMDSRVRRSHPLVLTHGFMGKSTWDSFSSYPRRFYLYFYDDGRVQLLDVGFELGDWALQQFSMNFTVIASTQHPYHIQVADTEQNWAEMKAKLEAGYEPMEFDVASVFDEPSIVFQDTLRQLGYRSDIYLISPPYWYNTRHALGGKFETIRPEVSMGEILSVSTKYLQWDYRFNPCWMPAAEEEQGVGTATDRLHVYLRLGHDVRVSVNTTYYSVLEVMQMGSEFTFLLATHMDIVSSDLLQTFAVKSLASSMGDFQSCTHVMESSEVKKRNESSGVKVGWYVDTRSWTQVYAVNSNSRAAYGSLSDLAAGVREGRDVRLWIQSTNMDRSRFLDTHMSSVTDDGKVSTESVMTWKTTTLDTVNINLGSECDYEYILVTSDGDVQVLTFNIWTQPTVEVLADVIITWFMN